MKTELESKQAGLKMLKYALVPVNNMKIIMG